MRNLKRISLILIFLCDFVQRFKCYLSFNQIIKYKHSLKDKKISEVEDFILGSNFDNPVINYTAVESKSINGTEVLFPELAQAGIDEKALRSSPFGKILFGILDLIFPG